MTLDWFAEPFQPYGSFTGEGARRVLGKPELDPLAVLVREMGQNAWDAKRPDARTVSFSLTGWGVTAEQRSALRVEVFARRPPAGLPNLASSLDADDLSVLCVGDRGTTVLGGPTRADEPSNPPTDFIDYVFNMGQPRDIEGGGGTYGFGKTITYVVSRASAVVVHTRTQTDHGLESRLIGIAIGSQYEDGQRRFTGRHWWGVVDGPIVQPVRGSEADELAMRLGLPGIRVGETGTDILIVAPDFGGRAAHDGIAFMADAAQWHFWPKTIESVGGSPGMRFAFAWDRVDIAMRPVAAYPPLQAFARAFEGVKAFQRGDPVRDDVTVRPIESQRPRRRLGALGIVRVPRLPRMPRDAMEPEDDEERPNPAGFQGNSHHVALMRQVNLIVNYRPGPELPVADIEWAGVFINEPDIDPAFAEAEPPTHDEWKPAMVADKVQRRLVNLALKGIDAEVRLQFGGMHPLVESEVSPSPVVIADALGGLLAGSEGIGPSRQVTELDRTDRAVGTGRRRPALVDIASRLITFRGETCTETRFRVRSPEGGAVTITAEAFVVIDGSRVERDPPLGSLLPSVIGWGTANAIQEERLLPGREINIPPGDEQTWVVIVRNPAAAAVSTELRASTTS